MSDERKMILTMLAEGKISAEEANVLLDALATSETKPVPPVPPMPPKVVVSPPTFAPQGHAGPQAHWGHHEERRHNPLRVSAQFVEAMAQVGLKNLSEDELWQLQIHQVRPGYVKQLQEAGLTDLSVDDIVQKAIHRERSTAPAAVRQLALEVSLGLQGTPRPGSTLKPFMAQTSRTGNGHSRFRKDLARDWPTTMALSCSSIVESTGMRYTSTG